MQRGDHTDVIGTLNSLCSSRHQSQLGRDLMLVLKEKLADPDIWQHRLYADEFLQSCDLYCTST